jgi:myosin-3
LYYLFDSAEKERLHLTTPADFDALGGRLWDDNSAMLEDLEEAMEVVGFDGEDRTGLYSMLGAILHLGNVQFEAVGEHSELRDGPALGYVAELLGVPVDDLKTVLLGFDTVTRGESIRRLYNKDQSYDCRDALAKALYGSLFGWVVQNVNERLSPQLASLRRTGGRPGAAKREGPAFEIGVLDIFGFENFQTNSFEQMCINVAHEQLQFFFNQHTFRLELEEYEQEGIDGNAITFRDNKPLLDMFLGRPIGVFSLLDEECNFPKATDASFAAKLDQHFGTNEAYAPVKMARGHPAFAIHHFAADVEYNATNMIEKNRDNLAAGIVALMQRGELPLLCDVFNGEILPTGQIRAVRRTEEERRVRRGEVVAAAQQQEQGSSKNTANRKAPSLSSQFKASLAALVDHMNSCFPHFIRCIKPNYDQVPNNFVEDFVRTQLSYTGVLEATRIRQEGYSWRPSFPEFVRRYKLLAFPITKLDMVKETEASAVKILQYAGLKNWKVGKTKLFLKFYHLDQLEDKVAAFYKDVLRTQCAARAHFARKIYNRRLALAQMSARERALAEAREAEERAVRKAEREAELSKEIEAQRLAREAAELDARRAEDDRRRQELEAMRAQAEAEKAQAEAERLNKLGEAEAARKSAEEQRALAESLAREREVAQREAEEARLAIERQRAELEALALATQEARAQAEQAAKEVKKQAFERTRSRKVRQKELENRDKEAQRLAEQQRQEAEQQRLAHERAMEEARRMAAEQRAEAEKRKEEEEARYRDELRRMQEAAEEARRRAEEASQRASDIEKRAELERAAEEARLQAERDRELFEKKAADFRRPDFSLTQRLRELGVTEFPADVKVEDRKASGWLTKLGQFRKNWRQRYFVVDLDNMMLRYFASEASKKEKAAFAIDEVMRVFKPRSSSFSQVHNAPNLGKHQNLLMIEVCEWGGVEIVGFFFSTLWGRWPHR